MIVADTNLLLDLYLAGRGTAQAEAVGARDPVWVAPLLWRSEFRNALAGLVRRQVLGIEDVVEIVREAEHAMLGREYSVLSQHVLRLAARSGCSAYDCEFVALAEDLRVRLVTGDRQVLRAFPALAIAPEAFVA